MELAEPSIATAFDKCVKMGATKIICHPYFLSRGRHVQEDIPALLLAASSNHENIEYVITEPLGMQDELTNAIDLCIKKALQ